MIAVKSSKPKKQRKFFYSKPLHVKQKSCSAHLSEKLRRELQQRSLPLRVDDTVRIMRGSHKKHEGKVTTVNYAKNTVFIEKLNRKKADGTEIPVPIQTSNVMIIEIIRDDEKRVKRKVLKKKKVEKETEKVKEKKVVKKEKAAGKPTKTDVKKVKKVERTAGKRRKAGKKTAKKAGEK